MSRRRQVRNVLAAFAVLTTACAGQDVATQSHVVEAPAEVSRITGENVTTFAAAPDGTLFASTLQSLHRADAPEYDVWNVVADYADVGSWPARAGFEVKELFVPSRDTVFARTFGRIVRWTSAGGLDAFTSDTLQATLWDMWGKSSREVYAVGSIGTFLEFDGERWSLLHNPLLEGPIDAHDDYNLWRITGVGGALYLATGSTLYQLAGAYWSTLALPEHCRPGPLAGRRGALIVDCPAVGLYERAGDGWRLLTGETERPALAVAASDGAVLLTHMHAASESFREIVRDGVVIHRHARPIVNGPGTVAAHAEWLLFFRWNEGDSVLLRSPRR